MVMVVSDIAHFARASHRDVNDSHSACRNGREFRFDSEQYAILSKQSHRLVSLPEYGKSCGASSLPASPFFALPALHRELQDQLPSPDPGFWRTNLEVLSVVIRRSLGRNTKARTIRQAPHHITDGGSVSQISKKTM